MKIFWKNPILLQLSIIAKKYFLILKIYFNYYRIIQKMNSIQNSWYFIWPNQSYFFNLCCGFNKKISAGSSLTSAESYNLHIHWYSYKGLLKSLCLGIYATLSLITISFLLHTFTSFFRSVPNKLHQYTMLCPSMVRQRLCKSSFIIWSPKEWISWTRA